MCVINGAIGGSWHVKKLEFSVASSCVCKLLLMIFEGFFTKAKWRRSFCLVVGTQRFICLERFV